MITTYYSLQKGILKKDSGPDRWQDLLRMPGVIIWIDLEDPSAEEIGMLQERFRFHPLSLEDCIHQEQRAKIEDYEDHSFLVLLPVRANREMEISTNQIGTFVGSNFLATVHRGKVEAIEETLQRCESDPRCMSRGVGFLLYNLIDVIVDKIFPILNDFDEEIDRLEDEALENPTKDTLNRIFALKRDLVDLRKIVIPSRAVLNCLCDRPYSFVSHEDCIYFRDVYDHLIRIYDMIETYRDLLTGAMEIYLSMISNRLNETMRRLTIIAVIFMPITFITGFFGMNIDLPGWMKAYNTGPLFWHILVGITAISLVMYLLLARLK